MRQSRTESRHFVSVTVSVFNLVLVVKTHFAKTPVRINLVSVLHLFDPDLVCDSRFELLVVLLLGHHLVGEGSAAHPRLVSLLHVHFHEIFALNKLSRGLGLSLQLLKLCLFGH